MNEEQSSQPVDSLKVDDNINETNNTNEVEEEQEEFLLHLRFDSMLNPALRNTSDIQFLGHTDNNNMLIKIGDLYYQGSHDNNNQSSLVFTVDKQTKNIVDTNICRSRLNMQRVVLKEKKKQPAPENEILD